MRTIFYHVALVGMLLYGAIFRIPVLLMKKGKEAKKFARKVCRNWSIGLIWAAKAKVEIKIEEEAKSRSRINNNNR